MLWLELGGYREVAQQPMARRALQWSLLAVLMAAVGGAAGWWWLAGRRAEGGSSNQGTQATPASQAIQATRASQATRGTQTTHATPATKATPPTDVTRPTKATPATGTIQAAEVSRRSPGQTPGSRLGALTEQQGRELLRLATQAGVRPVPVRRMTLRRYVEATGSVTAVRDVNLSFGVAGRLKAVHVAEGERVKAGQVLAALDDTSQQLAYVRARNAYEQARLELGPAQVEESRLAMEAARRDLEATKLVAPFDGVVVSVGAKPGESVGASQVVVRLVDLASLQVEVAVDEVDLPYVRPGQPALVSVKGYPDLILRGTVERLTPAGRTQGDLVLFDVVVRLQEARPELLPGMTATARIEVERAENVLAVPEEAVVELGGRALVSRVVGDRVELTAVELGVSDGRFVEIRSGLGEGDQVLATNYEVYRQLSGGGTGSGGAGPSPGSFPGRMGPSSGPLPGGAGPSPGPFFRIGPRPVPREAGRP